MTSSVLKYISYKNQNLGWGSVVKRVPRSLEVLVSFPAPQEKNKNKTHSEWTLLGT
jgi:hypothetical protein